MAFHRAAGLEVFQQIEVGGAVVEQVEVVVVRSRRDDGERCDHADLRRIGRAADIEGWRGNDGGRTEKKNAGNR